MRESLVVFKTYMPRPISTLAKQIAFLNEVKSELDGALENARPDVFRDKEQMVACIEAFHGHLTQDDGINLDGDYIVYSIPIAKNRTRSTAVIPATI